MYTNLMNNFSLNIFLGFFLIFVSTEIIPVEENDCLILRELNNLFEDSDRCVLIFLDEDALNCPFYFNTTESIRVTSDIIMNRSAVYYQEKFQCIRFLIGTSNMSYFIEFFTKDTNETRFLPFTKIIVFNSSSAEEVILPQDQLDFAYFNGLYFISAFLDYEKNLNLVNLLTEEAIMGSNSSLEDVIGDMHPLFEGRFYPREINISLFHCPPFVIVSKNNQTNETTFDGVEYNLIDSITKDWHKGITVHYYDDYKVRY